MKESDVKIHNIICKDVGTGVLVETVASRRDMLSLAIKRTPQPLWCSRRLGNSSG